jgi:hypothetical protein
MKARSFNSVMPKYNELWAGKGLNMNINNHAGPDLIDGNKAVEIKFKLIHENKYSDKCWRVLEHQLDYDKIYSEIYWGFGFYSLNKEVKNINKKDIINLENLVNFRELYLVNWDWVKQFPIYLQIGKTKLSSWNHVLLYPRMNKLFPKSILSKEVSGGRVIFTEGINLERFNLNEEDVFPNLESDCPF